MNCRPGARSSPPDTASASGTRSPPSVRRHLLCPLFAPRFVSAFFFRAQGSAAARRDGGLKGGRAVYAVSARGSAAAAAIRETFLQDASRSRRTAGASGLRGGRRRRMSGSSIFKYVSTSLSWIRYFPRSFNDCHGRQRRWGRRCMAAHGGKREWTADNNTR